ncbi:hypothetical protein ACFQJ5_05620 [Halomicroarcula sp. GCM10025324]|uniref:hypothetical protein n=1 Tax=Haloarcula TaxID=2237 RepID=UPI0023E8221D|nr:hypothetical protein [Halomicroarcula sp. ZS-22-S1]
MSSEDGEIDDVVEVCVPPISMADEERGLANGQDIDLIEFADFATSKAGTAGGLGVALDSLQALSEDIETFAQTGAAPGDLELHAEAIQDVVRILTSMAAAEIDSYDTPLYTDADSNPTDEDDQASASSDSSTEENSIPKENLMKVTVDRISGSGNIIAEPVDAEPNHIHVQNGTVGETAVAYYADGNLCSKGGTDKPYTFPYESDENGQRTLQRDDAIPLTEGQHIQVHDASKEEGFVYIDGYDLQAIKLDDEIKDGATVLLEITDVKTNTAVGQLEDQSTSLTSSRNSKTFKPNPKSKRTSRRKSGTSTGSTSNSGGIPKVSGGPAGTKNDLLSGKKL